MEAYLNDLININFIDEIKGVVAEESYMNIGHLIVQQAAPEGFVYTKDKGDDAPDAL